MFCVHIHVATYFSSINTLSLNSIAKIDNNRQEYFQMNIKSLFKTDRPFKITCNFQAHQSERRKLLYLAIKNLKCILYEETILPKFSSTFIMNSHPNLTQTQILTLKLTLNLS